jgi:hypothetical protein
MSDITNQQISQIAEETDLNMIEVSKAIFESDSKSKSIILPNISLPQCKETLQSFSSYKAEEIGRFKVLFQNENHLVLKWVLPEGFHSCKIMIRNQAQGGSILEFDPKVNSYKMKARIFFLLNTLLIFLLASFVTGSVLIFLPMFIGILYFSQVHGEKMLQSHCKLKLLTIMEQISKEHD